MNEHPDENEFIETKFTYHKGQLPGDMAAEWMTEDDWAAWQARVDEYKRNGEYMEPVEYTIRYKPIAAFEAPPAPEGGFFQNMRLLIPAGCLINNPNEG